MNESFVEMPQGEKVPQTPEEMYSVEPHVEETLRVVNADIGEVARLSRAVGEHPQFGFEDDLSDTIEASVARYREELEKIKEAGTRGAGQRELKLE